MAMLAFRRARRNAEEHPGQELAGRSSPGIPNDLRGPPTPDLGLVSVADLAEPDEARSAIAAPPSPRPASSARQRRGGVGFQALLPARAHVAAGLNLVRAQEDERRRIARDLHDVVGQALAAVKISLDRALRRGGSPESKRQEIGEALAIVEVAIGQVRALAVDLRPPILDDFGLVAALRWYVRRHGGHAGLAVVFDADSVDGLFDPGLESACFRIAQEAITNAIRHARATQLSVGLHLREGQLFLEVRDDGTGFDLVATRSSGGDSGGLGLSGMGGRAALLGGELEIETGLGRGTLIRARFPLDQSLTTRWRDA